jgi:hypothetical protein
VQFNFNGPTPGMNMAFQNYKDAFKSIEKPRE